ncbi:MAG TPA: DUF4249 family protein [Flavobacterium sp.]|nr:DUF4249 family protein [Flavobacterium sp.]
MKKVFQIILFFFSLTLISCEEEIILDFDKTVPRLVIEANIFAEEEVASIQLSKTTDFYSNAFPKVDGAEIQIKNLETNEIYTFINIGSGNYFISNIDFQIGYNYELTVIYNNETYIATSTLLPTPEILSVEQVNDGGIMGDSYEFRFYYQDNPDEENFYLSVMNTPKEVSYGTWNDQFDNGNLTNDLFLFSKDNLKTGDTLQYYITSISKDYYNYLSKLLSISGSSSNPFASPMGTIKGNIVNQTNKDNHALGYFHIAKRNYYTYIVK